MTMKMGSTITMYGQFIFDSTEVERCGRKIEIIHKTPPTAWSVHLYSDVSRGTVMKRKLSVHSGTLEDWQK
jgi:hypothetical protein